MSEAVEKAEAKLDRPLGQKNQPVAEGGLERKFRTSKEKLTSPWATGAAIVIAVIWTIPTFGLLVSSIRTPEQIRTTGWWTWFTEPSRAKHRRPLARAGAKAASAPGSTAP